MKVNKCVNEYKQVLDNFDDRATLISKVQALKPLIIKNVKQGGLKYPIIVSDLKEAGLEISVDVLKTYFSRIRRSNKLSNSNNQPEVSKSTLSQKALKQSPASKTKPLTENYDHLKVERGRIESPADLKKIRNMDIDLDAYRRLEEARRKSLKKST